MGALEEMQEVRPYVLERAGKTAAIEAIIQAVLQEYQALQAHPPNKHQLEELGINLTFLDLEAAPGPNNATFYKALPKAEFLILNRASAGFSDS
ncbi:hypothetical protein FQN55_003207 [Onygenales sp. PD_40]|nr:hypothetical protein FQN55_003207 [Onygenales sp. PD_40]